MRSNSIKNDFFKWAHRFMFSKLLQRPYNPKSIDDRINGTIHYWRIKVDDPLSDHTPNEFNLKYHSFLEYIISNEQKFPTTTGNLELGKDIFLNSPAIIQYGGKYLPIIDISATIDDSWLKIIPFRKELFLDDYLYILSKISENPSKPDKERISLIYQRLVELGYQKSSTIRKWGKSHKLLSASSNVFIPSNQLAYITVDGFKNESQVYVGNVDYSLKDGITELLETFGVKVITKDKIKPVFNGVCESHDMLKLLLSKLDAITLLKGSIKDKETFRREKSALNKKIVNSNFYHCQSILLSYGNEDDILTKNTFALAEKFYYVGSLKPTRIEPLIAPLSKHLGLKNVNEELLIILITQSENDLIEYLKDKGYPTELIEKSRSKPYNPIIPDKEEANNNLSNNSFTDKQYSEDTHTKEYIDNYSDKLKEFMGGDYSMPTDKIKIEHVISRYRVLIFIKGLGGNFTLAEDFDEKEYIKNDEYAPIPLADGKHINIQSVKFGIWHLSPVIWHDIVDKGNYACLCTGNGENDFKMIMGVSDINEIAESKKNVFMRLTPTASMDIIDTINSVFSLVLLFSIDDIFLTC